MNKILASIFFLSLVLLLFVCPATAQQQASKSKSSVKLYEKGQIKANVIIQNAAGINSDRLEFSPTFYQNGIIYVSLHKNGPIDPNTGKPFMELFYAETDAQGLPQRPRDFSLNVNSQLHEGPVSLSRDQNLIFFSRNNLEGGIGKANSQGKVAMKIYEAKRGKFDWENISELPFNNDEYTCVHPSLSADGKKLFFASDMPGGYGGMDLYYVEKKTDTWSKPINLGPSVNTTDNELFPYLHESNTLFFSSNGHVGNGGLDIFMIDISSKEWGEVYNLGLPFNSAKDDLGFIINEAATRGYLASDREGGLGQDDIYMFEADAPIIDEEAVTLSAMIIAYNEKTNERIPDAVIRIFQRSADGFIEGDDLYDVQMLPSDKGDLVMKLVRKNASDLDTPYIKTNSNGESLYEVKQNKSYLVLVTKDGFESAELLYSTVDEIGAQTIRVPMKPKSCASLAGVVSVAGYQTKVPNALVRIVNESTGTEDLLRTNANGEFDYCLPIGQEFAVYAEKEGYTKGMTKISTVGTNLSKDVDVTVSLQPIAENIMKEPIKTGSVIVLENIYYDFNQFFIRKGAASELDALYELMRLYPSMEVELTSHTDSRGKEEYNLELSLKRAESAKQYLVNKGISESRIKAFGFGESQLRNQCADDVECTDEEHQYNRRTEVKVTRIDEPVRVQYQDGNPVDDGRG